jgi:hypothetical protein
VTGEEIWRTLPQVENPIRARHVGTGPRHSKRSPPGVSVDTLPTPVSDLVAALLRRSNELRTLAEVGHVVVSALMSETRAEACCLLVEDRRRWQVVGSQGLRQLEQRLSLGDDHWLVQEIVRRRRAVVIDDSDLAREELRAAPLASWRSVLVEGTPSATALIICARSDRSGFTRADIKRVSQLCAESDQLVLAARDLRELARALNPYADHHDVPCS